jgi:hypothetical protein
MSGGTSRGLVLTAVASLLCLLTLSAAAADKETKLTGDWTGDSICVGYRPACHDEKVVYHVRQHEDDPSIVTIAADKIIDGKPEEMYVLDFKYDRTKGTLFNEFTVGHTHGIWEYTVKGDVMEGTLKILPDKTIGRRVKVTKVK